MSRKEAEEKIRDFFKEKHDKEEVRKMKKLAMSYQIKLKDERKLFCNKCYSMNLRVKGMKYKMKNVTCQDCGNLMRWKIKS